MSNFPTSAINLTEGTWSDRLVAGKVYFYVNLYSPRLSITVISEHLKDYPETHCIFRTSRGRLEEFTLIGNLSHYRNSWALRYVL